MVAIRSTSIPTFGARIMRTSQRASLHPVLTNITLWRIQFQFLKACRVLLFFFEDPSFGLVAARHVVFELSLQGRKEAYVQENHVLETAGEFEIVWRSQVAVLTHMVPAELSIQQLKSRLFSLTSLLSIAPSEEDAVTLLPFVQQVRRELNARRTGPKAIDLLGYDGDTS